ncbi:MAG: alpha/beta hydrolase domain-containing protein, partial [Acidobacteria bacterium]|nr:alpha/beta hydrolase domain-containing protein [Acidobacteriota bacterium]
MPRCWPLVVIFVFCSGCLEARITRVVIDQRETPAYQGQVFGEAGPYETLHGRFFGELDPGDSHNSIITDLLLAPRNARGRVEYWGTFALSKPVDMAKASGVLFYTVPNRGNGEPSGSPDGHVTVVSGWQGDVLPRPGLQTLAVPMATGPGGAPLTGPVIQRRINIPPGTHTVDLRILPHGGLTYQRPVTLDTAKARLTRRTSQAAPAIPLADSGWAFADCTAVPFPGTPDPSKICVREGFDPASEYVLVFTARDPLVLGMGYAATRDLNSFLRYSAADDTGAPNPVAGRLRWAVSFGSSQSGNFIRSFIHLGFNQDEAGRIVWDGANPHVAARQLALNFRFAVGGGVAGPFEPGSEAVLWWSDYPDTVRKRPTAGLLTRCRASGTCPKIFETFGGLEFWYPRESPNL